MHRNSKIFEYWILFLIFVYGMGLYIGMALTSFGAVFLVLTTIALLFRPMTWVEVSLKHRLAMGFGVAWILYSTIRLSWVPGPVHYEIFVRVLYLLIPILACWLVGVLSHSKKFKFDEVRFEKLVLVLMAGAVVELIYTIVTEVIRGNGAIGFDRNTIYYGYSMIPVVVFFGELLFRKIPIRIFRPWMLHGIVIVGWLAAILSTSRMAILATSLYLVLRYLPLLFQRKQWKVLVVAASMGIGLVGGLYLFNDAFQFKVHSAFKKGMTFKSWHGRIQAWEYNFMLFRENPIWGVGREQNPLTPSRKDPSKPDYLDSRSHFAHNFLIQSLADSGIVGTSLLLLFFIYVGICIPISIPFLLIYGFSGMSDTILIRTHLAHPFYFYLFLFVWIQVRYFRPEKRRIR